MILLGLLCLAASLFLLVNGECKGDIKSVMMNNTEMRCGDMNVTTQRRVCEVLSEDDERHLVCGEQDVKCNRPLILCPDGSLSKTCFPVSDSNSVHYKCLCHSTRDHQMYVPTDTQGSWSPWQRLTAHNKGFDYTRKLYVNSSAECLVQEHDSLVLVNIVSEYQLTDSIFSSSSTYAGENGGPHRAKIDMYLTSPCAWVAQHKAISEWLEIQLPPIYSVGGILIKKRCDDDRQYPTEVTIKTAEYDLLWQDVIENQNLLYTDDATTVWFPMIYTTPIWRIYITGYNHHPSMKCDLKGFRNY